MDLESYLTNYTGVTRLKRLAFIASASPALKAEALRLAVDEVKRTTNTAQYAELLAIAGDALKRDDAWVDAEDKKAVHKLERLENELNNHKTSLVKESIRMGHNDLGDFHSERGDFAAALKCYVRTRDYCTTSKHIITMCLNVIRVSVRTCATSHPRRHHSLHPLEPSSHRLRTARSSDQVHMGNFTHVANYITKAESTPDTSDAVVLTGQLKVAAGLAHLEGKKYKQAARKFLEASPELGTSFSDVMSQQDVATYGGLCALASYDRAELKAKLIDNSPFRAFLELVPEVCACTPPAFLPPASTAPAHRPITSNPSPSTGARAAHRLPRVSVRVVPQLPRAAQARPPRRPPPPRPRRAAVRRHPIQSDGAGDAPPPPPPPPPHPLHLHLTSSPPPMVQYFSPFVSVDMTLMASAFNTPVEALEKELAQLIMDGKIASRIDSQNKVLQSHGRHVTRLLPAAHPPHPFPRTQVLYARTADQRTATFSKTLGLGADYLRETRALLLRINLMRADFVVKGSSEAHGPSKSSRQEQRHASGPSAGPSASSSVPPAPPGGGAFGD